MIQLNARERILEAAFGGRPDCVPVAPYAGNWGAVQAHMPIGEYNHSGKKMAEAQKQAWVLTQQDTIIPQSDNYYIAQAFGCKIVQPANSTPMLVKTALNSLSEVDRLKVPDPYSEGRMPVYIEAVSILAKEFGGEVAIRSGGTGPFSLAGHLLGTENLLVEIALAEAEEDEEKQRLLFQLMEITTQALISFDTAILKAGADFAVCGDSSASPDLTSPAIYKKYIYPFEKRFFREINKVCQCTGAASLLHICGNTTSILDSMANTGAHILELDYKVDLAEARKICGPKQCLMGNLDPVEVLLNGSEVFVEERSQEAIQKAGLDGAFILGSGCEVAPATRLKNLVAMVRIGHSTKY